MCRVPKITYFLFLLAVLGVRLNAEPLEGYWKYTEDAIKEITNYTLEARKSGRQSGDSSAAEIADAYRSHVRQFKISEDNRVHVRLIQFKRNSDPYPEYYRDFHLDYSSQGDGFSIGSGEREIFTGYIEDGTLHLKDTNSGTVLTMVAATGSEIPRLSEGSFNQPTLDRQPRPKKLVDPEYPAELERQGISGVVQLSFFVNADGTTSEIRVISSPHPGLERAAIEAILDSTFHPGRADRKSVRTHVKLPITFR